MGSRARQGQLWGTAARDWAELQEPPTAPLWEALLDVALVGPGTRVLDACCRAGGASVLAAGRGAQVNGFDASTALVALARRRLPDGDFRIGDLADLPYATGTFDAIIAANVLEYTADPIAAARELRRVCGPEGRVVIATWGTPEECQKHALLRAVYDTWGSTLWNTRESLDTSLSTPDALNALLIHAGLTLVGSGTVSCLYTYPTPEIAWRALAASGPLQAASLVVGRAPLKAAMLRAVTPYQTDSGAVCLANCFRYVAATP